MKENNVIFTALNKDRNITYTLTEGRPRCYGRSHILERRPAMVTKINAIKKTVENTDFAYMDKDHPKRERLYCMGADSEMPKMYMVVVAEYNSDNGGTIITAWPTDKITAGGDMTYANIKK